MLLNKGRILGFGSSGKTPKVSSCPAGHALEPWTARPGRCDGCHCAVYKGDCVMDCRECNWYLCQKCQPQERAADDSIWGALSSVLDTASQELHKITTEFGSELDAVRSALSCGAGSKMHVQEAEFDIDSIAETVLRPHTVVGGWLKDRCANVTTVSESDDGEQEAAEPLVDRDQDLAEQEELVEQPRSSREEIEDGYEAEGEEDDGAAPCENSGGGVVPPASHAQAPLPDLMEFTEDLSGIVHSKPDPDQSLICLLDALPTPVPLGSKGAGAEADGPSRTVAFAGA